MFSISTIPGAKRMIMGHTIEDIGINCVYEDRAIRLKTELLELIMFAWSVGDRRENVKIAGIDIKSSGLDLEKEEGLGLLLPENQPKQVEVKA
ncbi:hypothetical protein QN277_023286 [Acacia crassicarpa]|uniref:Uncharacterized protein n=1 Tax=Acacia crassicarpa TaxID=499986 RepID=A0AAE1JLE9_9FABA|nr:hypothetical protein QN277_023286 [Acacia crassicarpa]